MMKSYAGPSEASPGGVWGSTPRKARFTPYSSKEGRLVLVIHCVHWLGSFLTIYLRLSMGKYWYAKYIAFRWPGSFVIVCYHSEGSSPTPPPLFVASLGL
jgi:hypothetical protein